MTKTFVGSLLWPLCTALGGLLLLVGLAGLFLGPGYGLANLISVLAVFGGIDLVTLVLWKESHAAALRAERASAPIATSRTHYAA